MDALAQPAAELIASTINRQRFRFANEWELQRGIALVLTSLGLSFKSEVKLGPGDRIDFLVADIGIEVKVDMGLAGVTRQLWRYADYPEIQTFILVTTRHIHQQLPLEMKGKQILVVYLLNSFL